MSNDPRALTRDQLSKIALNPRALIALEQLISRVNTDIPSDILTALLDSSSINSRISSLEKRLGELQIINNINHEFDDILRSIGILFPRNAVETPRNYLNAIDDTVSITLPTTPTLFKPTLTVLAQTGVTYDQSSGVFEYTLNKECETVFQFNTEPSSANKHFYFYEEISFDRGSTWSINKFTGQDFLLTNTTKQTLKIVMNHKRLCKRMYAWGEATIYLKTYDVPGTTVGTVVTPAFLINVG